MTEQRFTAATCFSGIGAPEISGPEFDWQWCAEIEPFPAAVLAARFGASAPRFMPPPDAPNLELDAVNSRRASIKAVAKIKGGNGAVNLGDVSNPAFIEEALALGPIDLLVGGPPCQAFSFAGLRQSLDDDRGNLSLRFVEIAHAIRPRILLVENVPGWLSTDDNAFGCFLGAIVGGDAPLRNPLGGKWPNAGMASGPRSRIAWRVFDAQHFGLAQRRRRVFAVVCFGDDDPCRILFESKRMRGDFEKGEETREAGEIAETISARSKGGGGLGTDFKLDGGIQPVATKLKGEGHDSSEDGTGRVTLIPVAFAIQERAGAQNPSSGPVGKGYTRELAYTIEARRPQSVAFVQNQRDEIGETSVVDALAANPGMKQQTFIAYDLRGREGGAQFEGPHETANIRAASGGSSKSYILETERLAVRRLTPIECERLQGFPDNFTAISGNVSRKVSPAMAGYMRAHSLPVEEVDGVLKTTVVADGPRYKALGNSWAAANGRWIIERIYRELEGKL